MKKMIIWLTLCIIVLFTTAFSTGMFQVIPFLGVISFNGQLKTIDDEYRLFHYREHVYVPIRYITEEMGGVVGYDTNTQKVSIHYLDEQTLQSKINNYDVEEQMKLSIYSEKSIYKEGETIRIWTSLENTGGRDFTLFSSEPLIYFNIEYPEGVSSGDLVMDVHKPFAFGPNDEYRRQLTPLNLAQFYYVQYHKDDETYEEFIQRYPEPFQLPKGKYTVGARADFSIGAQENKVQLDVEIEIEVK